MHFASVPFAYFFLLVGSVAWLLRPHRSAQNLFLLIASYVFYARFTWHLPLLLAGSTALAYVGGELLWRLPASRLRRVAQWLAIGAQIALLGVFKLHDFYREHVTDLAAWLGLSAHVALIDLVLPAGISFYVFQAIAYLVDSARGNAVRPRHWLDFALFMAFFPKLLAGPICRSHELLPQIMAPAPRVIGAPSEALTRIAAGLLKKVVLASYLSTHLVDVAFQNPSHYSALELWIALFAYSAEIYLDFSGYTDMALGLALLLGYRLPENFHAPYAATNIGEFWKRWHVTFSRWLRDYLFFTLGGSRGSRWRTSLNYLLTFVLCGFWHGTRAGFLVWGLLHGIALALYKLSVDWRRRRGSYPPPPSLLRAGAGVTATLLFCVVVRVFFRGPDLGRALEYLTAMFAPTPRLSAIDPWVVAITVLGFALNFVGAPLRFRFARLHQRLAPPLRPLLWLSLGVLTLALKPHEVAPYIYFGF